MKFTIEEARAGHELARRDVERAGSALRTATGRRERRAAQAELDRTQGVLDLSTKMLEKIARELGVDPYPPAPAPTAPAPRQGGSAAQGPRFADTMLLSDAIQTLESFGEARRAQGDSFVESRFVSGAYLYGTGHARTGIRVWGDEKNWVISVFSAARVGMRPGLDLYQFVSRWRTTRGIGAPYVVQDGDRAAIMCERTFQGSQFASDATAWRIISSTIDLIGESAQEIARWLAHSDDGIPFTAEGDVGLTSLLGWWEVSDERIGAAAV